MSFHSIDNHFEEIDNLVQLLRWRAQNNSQKIAYTFLEDGEDEESNITYEELDFKAKTIGGMLQSVLNPGDRALMLFPNSLDYITSFFGCLYAGIIAVPAYTPERSAEYLARLKGIIKDANITLILTNSSTISLIAALVKEDQDLLKVKWVLTDKLDNQLARLWKEIDIDRNSLAMLQYTSGSTSSPKGVMVAHKNLIYNQKMIRESRKYSIGNDPMVLVGWAPLAHAMGLTYNTLSTLFAGGTYIFMEPAMFLQKPIRWLKAIAKYKANVSCAPNFAYDLCAQVITAEQKRNLDLSSWKMAMCGSEPIRTDTFERFSSAFAQNGFKRESFHPAYGLSEATVIVSAGQDEHTPSVINVCKNAMENNNVKIMPEKNNETISIVSCGTTFLEQEIVIVDPNTLTICAENTLGEIWVKGPNIVPGYWNKPEETEETFHGYLQDGSHRGPFLRTGDMGFFYEGRIYVAGRLKDLIIIRGKNHYPQDIELTVDKSHPALKECCGAAFSIDVDNEEHLVIVNEIKEEFPEPINAEEVISCIRKAVAEKHRLDAFAIALLKNDEVPKTGSRKIQRRASREAFLSKKFNVIAEWNKENEFGIRKSNGDEENVDFDLLVVGGGPGGYVAAIQAAHLGKKVAIVEKAKVGGVCLNEGCIPSKALIHAAEAYSSVHTLSNIGITMDNITVDLVKVQEWKESIIRQLSEGLNTLMNGNKIRIIHGEASFQSPTRVSVVQGKDAHSFSFKHCILATGSRPAELPEIPFGNRILSSTECLSLNEIPKKLVIIGGGNIGIELGTVFARFGSKVTILETGGHILPGFEEEMTRLVERKLKKLGVEICTNSIAKGMEELKNSVIIKALVNGKEKEIEADYILVSVGRVPNTDGMGLRDIGLHLDLRGNVLVDKKGQTNIPNIYAIGDIVAGPKLAHKASFEGKIAIQSIVGKQIEENKVVPIVVYSDPEMASVGISESEAKEKNIDYMIGRFPYSANGRALSMNKGEGFIKMIAENKTGIVLGVQIVGHEASTIISEICLGINMGATLQDLERTIHAHPSFGEITQEVAEFMLGHPTHLVK